MAVGEELSRGSPSGGGDGGGRPREFTTISPSASMLPLAAGASSLRLCSRFVSICLVRILVWFWIWCGRNREEFAEMVRFIHLFLVLVPCHALVVVHSLHIVFLSVNWIVVCRWIITATAGQYWIGGEVVIA